MDNPQNLKKRLKSIGNINKITKAMELVAATKMRKAQEVALASRPYALTALELLANISTLENIMDNPFFSGMNHENFEKKVEQKTILFVLVASDKGLAGAFNGSLFKKFEQYIQDNANIHKNQKQVFIAVGEKASIYLQKRNYSIVEKFTSVGDFTTAPQVQPLVDVITKGYLAGTWQNVMVFSTHFTSALKQDALARKILPIRFEHIQEIIEEIIPTTGKFAELIKQENLQFVPQQDSFREYVIEPSRKVVFDTLVMHLILMQLYHLILEANASEHSARRLAMKTASDNASDLGQKINIQYNKVRQENITNQIIEISAAQEALS